MALLFLFLQSSLSFQKWKWININPSEADESECTDVSNMFDELAKTCDVSSDYYGGSDKCKDIFNSMVQLSCVRDDNVDVNDLISKIDKSVEYLALYNYLAKDVTIDFSKLPNKMKVVIYQESSSSSIKIKGNHDGKLLSLFAEADSFEIIDSDLSIDTFVINGGIDLTQSKFKVKAKQLDAHVRYFNSNNDHFGNLEFENLMFYDESYYIDEKFKSIREEEDNFVSIEFGKSSYIYNSTFHGQSYSLPNDKSKSFGLITGAQKITLIGSKDSYIPDNIVIDCRYYNPLMAPLDSIDPYLYLGEEEGEAKLLEEYKIVFTKAGDWTGLKKPKITIKLSNDKIKLDTTDIKDIAEINTVDGDGSNKKKGLETKYIIVIVVVVVVVVAAVVGVVVFVVLKKKKTKVNNNSASP